MMRNLFKVLLVSSALVAVSAPSAYAAAVDIEAAATTDGGDVVAAVQASISELGANPSLEARQALAAAAIALCPTGDTECVAAILTTFAGPGINVRLSAEQINVALASVGLTSADVPPNVIAATGGPAGGAAPTGPAGPAGGGNGNGGNNTPVSPT